MARARNSSSTLLVILALIITFPFWIAIGALIIGVVGAVFGVLLGVGGALFKALAFMVTLPFRIIFGWGDHGWWHFHHNGFGVLVLVIILALIIRSKSR